MGVVAEENIKRIKQGKESEKPKSPWRHAVLLESPLKDLQCTIRVIHTCATYLGEQATADLDPSYSPSNSGSKQNKRNWGNLRHIQFVLDNWENKMVMNWAPQ